MDEELNIETIEISDEINIGNISLEDEVDAQAAFVPAIVATDYLPLKNKPKINSVELVGDKSFEDLGSSSLTNMEIDSIINSIV